MGDVRDHWATEYNRKSFSATIDEDDWLLWLHQAVVTDDGELILTRDIPRSAKSRVMRLLVYIETSRALQDWGRHEGDVALERQAAGDVTDYQAELANWALALREKYVRTGGPDTGSEAGAGSEPGSVPA